MYMGFSFINIDRYKFLFVFWLVYAIFLFIKKIIYIVPN